MGRWWIVVLLTLAGSGAQEALPLPPATAVAAALEARLAARPPGLEAYAAADFMAQLDWTNRLLPWPPAGPADESGRRQLLRVILPPEPHRGAQPMTLDYYAAEVLGLPPELTLARYEAGPGMAYRAEFLKWRRNALPDERAALETRQWPPAKAAPGQRTVASLADGSRVQYRPLSGRVALGDLAQSSYEVDFRISPDAGLATGYPQRWLPLILALRDGSADVLRWEPHPDGPALVVGSPDDQWWLSAQHEWAPLSHQVAPQAAVLLAQVAGHHQPQPIAWREDWRYRRVGDLWLASSVRTAQLYLTAPELRASLAPFGLYWKVLVPQTVPGGPAPTWFTTRPPLVAGSSLAAAAALVEQHRAEFDDLARQAGDAEPFGWRPPTLRDLIPPAMLPARLR